MYPERLSLLLDNGIAPGNAAEMAKLCDEWFQAEPSLASFVFRSILGELAKQWDDPQGVPTSKWAPFDSILLPKLKRAAMLVSRDPAAYTPDEIIHAFHQALAAASRAGS